MAQAFDSKALFDDEVYSDITIKCAENEFKCHKIILCTTSAYFKALCGPGSKFLEGERASIELHEDSPLAVETLLRYLYNFSYTETQTIMGDFGVEGHMSVVVAACKYLMPELESEAMAGLEAAVTTIESSDKTKGVAKGVLQVIKLLASHKDYNLKFENTIAVLTQGFMVELFKIEEFRTWMDTDDGQQALVLATRAVTCGARVLDKKGWSRVRPSIHSITKCEACGHFWSTQVNLAWQRCHNCSIISLSRHDVIWMYDAVSEARLN